MSRLFWPLLVAIVFFSALVLWFCVPRITNDLTLAVEAVLEDVPWATYDLDGRHLVIRGIAPDEAIEQGVLERAANIAGIQSVCDEIIVPPLKEPFIFTLTRNKDGITISGDFPVGFDRFGFIDTIDNVYTLDNAGSARGADRRFADWAQFAAEKILLLDEGKVELVANKIRINGIVGDEAGRQTLIDAAAPEGVSLEMGDIIVKAPLRSAD